MPPGGKKKKKTPENRNNIVTNVVKTLKMVHIKKSNLKKQKSRF